MFLFICLGDRKLCLAWSLVAPEPHAGTTGGQRGELQQRHGRLCDLVAGAVRAGVFLRRCSGFGAGSAAAFEVDWQKSIYKLPCVMIHMPPWKTNTPLPTGSFRVPCS